jgi:demethylmenaquinone methyltransferase/2-methoxy-6-polyprenyl-1,4-benzoquinol methylase
MFHWYLRCFVKRVGFWLSGNKEAYNYLAESAADFYSVEEVRDLLLEAGFHEVIYRPILFGAAGIHIAVK